MTREQITHALRTSALPPNDALTAAVAHADSLAPAVYEQLARFCRGVCLLPEDENLLFYGLHVLAAARHPELWPRLVELARTPAEELSDLFAEHTPITLARLMLSVWDGDATALFRLIEHADMADEAKWALFDVLARLTLDGRIPRETTVAFLERFEAEGLADEASTLWWSWETTIANLGLTDLQQTVERAWQKPAFAHLSAESRASWREVLERPSTDPETKIPLDAADIRAIDDPAEALQWLYARETLESQYRQQIPPPPHALPDPAAKIRLDPDEEFWLARFLVSRQVDPTALPLVVIDGFFTASVIGPGDTPLDRLLPTIWGDGPSAHEPEWADDAQRDHVIGLLARMRAAITARRDGNTPHEPLLPLAPDGIEAARAWGEGFALGMEIDDDAWDPLFEDVRGAEDGLAILALCEGETEFFGRPATEKELQQIVERLPRILQNIAAYWRDPQRVYPKTVPIRVQKIGRNDPCPCGSGLKYKKCCASKVPPITH